MNERRLWCIHLVKDGVQRLEDMEVVSDQSGSEIAARARSAIERSSLAGRVRVVKVHLKEEVKAEFPNAIEGSIGWGYVAVQAILFLSRHIHERGQR